MVHEYATTVGLVLALLGLVSTVVFLSVRRSRAWQRSTTEEGERYRSSSSLPPCY